MAALLEAGETYSPEMFSTVATMLVGDCSRPEVEVTVFNLVHKYPNGANRQFVLAWGPATSEQWGDAAAIATRQTWDRDSVTLFEDSESGDDEDDDEEEDEVEEVCL